MHCRRQRVLLGPCLILFLGCHAVASDWPQFLGPTRDAVYTGPPLAEDWPAAGPPVVWSADVGEGYSSPIVGEERLVICHRIENELVIDCFDAKTGRKHWSFKHPMKFQDGAYLKTTSTAFTATPGSAAVRAFAALNWPPAKSSGNSRKPAPARSSAPAAISLSSPTPANSNSPKPVQANSRSRLAPRSWAARRAATPPSPTATSS